MSGFKPLPGKCAPRVTHRSGRSFASNLEAEVFDLLEEREKAEQIRNLKCQVHVYLTAARIVNIVDFAFELADTGEAMFAEAKGFETDIWRIKRRLWGHYGPGPLEIYKRGGKRGPRLVETIYPKTETQMQLGVQNES